jgi:hypothetical protein
VTVTVIGTSNESVNVLDGSGSVNVNDDDVPPAKMALLKYRVEIWLVLGDDVVAVAVVDGAAAESEDILPFSGTRGDERVAMTMGDVEARHSGREFVNRKERKSCRFGCHESVVS